MDLNNEHQKHEIGGGGFKAVDSEIEDKILVATLENHLKRNFLLNAWKEE